MTNPEIAGLFRPRDYEIRARRFMDEVNAIKEEEIRVEAYDFFESIDKTLSLAFEALRRYDKPEEKVSQIRKDLYELSHDHEVLSATSSQVDVKLRGKDEAKFNSVLCSILVLIKEHNGKMVTDIEFGILSEENDWGKTAQLSVFFI